MQKSDTSKPKHPTKSKAIDLKKIYGLLIESYLQSHELRETSHSHKKIDKNRVWEKAA